ncbi:unnamed protein product [Camellia sinensis]
MLSNLISLFKKFCVNIDLFMFSSRLIGLGGYLLLRFRDRESYAGNKTKENDFFKLDTKGTWLSPLLLLFGFLFFFWVYT